MSSNQFIDVKRKPCLVYTIWFTVFVEKYSFFLSDTLFFFQPTITTHSQKCVCLMTSDAEGDFHSHLCNFVKFLSRTGQKKKKKFAEMSGGSEENSNSVNWQADSRLLCRVEVLRWSRFTKNTWTGLEEMIDDAETNKKNRYLPKNGLPGSQHFLVYFSCCCGK